MGAAEHTVLSSDSVPFPITRYSSHVTKTLRTPQPRYEPVEWTRALARLVREEGVDLVVPVHEGTEILANTVKQRPDLCPDDCTPFLSYSIPIRCRGPPGEQVRIPGRATSGILLFDPETRLDRAFFVLNDEVIVPLPGASKMLGPGMLMYGWRKSSLQDNSSAASCVPTGSSSSVTIPGRCWRCRWLSATSSPRPPAIA